MEYFSKKGNKPARLLILTLPQTEVSYKIKQKPAGAIQPLQDKAINFVQLSGSHLVCSICGLLYMASLKQFN